MISLASIEQVSLAAIQAAVTLPDDAATQVCAVSEFYRWKRLCTGELEQWRILTKPVPGLPKGTAIRLKDLHARLFGEALKK